MRHFTFFFGYKIFEIWWYPSPIVRLDGNLPHPKGWVARAAGSRWIGERSSILDCLSGAYVVYASAREESNTSGPRLCLFLLLIFIGGGPGHSRAVAPSPWHKHSYLYS